MLLFAILELLAVRNFRHDAAVLDEYYDFDGHDYIAVVLHAAFLLETRIVAMDVLLTDLKFAVETWETKVRLVVGDD